MLHNLRHNLVRTIKSNLRHIVEIGEGSTNAGSTKGTGRAIVEYEFSQAIGTDNWVGGEKSLSFGSFLKIWENHAIGEGCYHTEIIRYGEKKRSFHVIDDENGMVSEHANRSWFEWFGEIGPDANQPYIEIFLHNQPGKQLVLEDNSAITFNIKVVGTDKNQNPNVNGFHLSGTIKRGSGASTTSIVGTVTVTSWRDNTSINARVTADTATGALKLEIQADGFSYWTWAASAWTVEYKWNAIT